MNIFKKKIAIIFGTRPDTIKLSPLIKELEKQMDYFEVIKIATAQHRQMLDQVLDVFNIIPDYDLNIMKERQTLSEITKSAMIELDKIFSKERPDLVVVQGDTTTTLVGALSAFYQKIPVAHVEAGLRTDDKFNPYPEEINRRLTSAITDLHFAPTYNSKLNLIKENINEKSIFITGNTVIDALDYVVKKNYKFKNPTINQSIEKNKKIVLITMHRRENWGEPIKSSSEAIKELANKFEDFDFIFPLHLNPIIRETVFPILSEIDNVKLIEPLDYLDFVNILAKSYIAITDSGGVQEEAPHFGVPVLVLRNTTERPEAIKFGTAKLIGLNKEKIINFVEKLILDKKEYMEMSNKVNPYGDGKASKRISKIILKYFGFSKRYPNEFKP